MLGNIPTCILENELEKRKKLQSVPRQSEIIDTMRLSKICAEYIKALATDGRHEKIEHYVFETAIECFYGPSVWDWVNSL